MIEGEFELEIEDIVITGLLLTLENGGRTADEIRAGVMEMLSAHGFDLQAGLVLLENLLSEEGRGQEYAMGLGATTS